MAAGLGPRSGGHRALAAWTTTGCEVRGVWCLMEPGGDGTAVTNRMWMRLLAMLGVSIVSTLTDPASAAAPRFPAYLPTTQRSLPYVTYYDTWYPPRSGGAHGRT